MDAIRKKMQSLKGETDSLYATIQQFEDATKESNRLADQVTLFIEDKPGFSALPGVTYFLSDQISHAASDIPNNSGMKYRPDIRPHIRNPVVHAKRYTRYSAGYQTRYPVS